MPPRQPLRLKNTAKTGTKPVRKALAPQTDTNRQLSTPEQHHSTMVTAAKSSRLATLLKAATHGKSSIFSPYPDLTLAIAMLEKRRQHLRAESAGEQLELIDKWLLSLNKMQTEMTRLRQLESLSSALSRRDPVS